MRVLLVNDQAVPDGGAELQALRLRDRLRARDHEVRLLASSATTSAAAPAADAVCFGTTHPRLRVLSQTVNPSAARVLRRELDRFRPDVVHVRMFLTQLSPLILPVLRGVPSLYHVVFYKAICPRGTKLLPDGTRCAVPAGVACLRNRCVTPQSWVLDMAQQRLWRRWSDAFDAVVAPSATMRARLEEAGIRVDDVIPNGVPRRALRPPLGGAPTAAYAGRLVPEKGVDVLLRAFAVARRAVPAARLLVAGDGRARTALEGLAVELGLAGHVEWLGHLPRGELERRFDAAWLQAVPGRWEEPLGNVALEAMMRGTALVASAVGGPAEVVEDGATGRLVPPGDVDRLATVLAELLGDPRACAAHGEAARAVALDRYDEEGVLARFEALYEGLVAGASTAPAGPA